MAEPMERIAADLLGTCPLPRSLYDRILLGHGSGGLLSAELIHRVFMPAFYNDVLSAMEDQATVRLPSHGHSAAPRIAITTDSFVVRPLFFPGGDIGKLAVHGTVNDLAVGGAKPLFLSAAFILEEGLALTTLNESSPRCVKPVMRRKSPWSPAIPRSWIAVRRTRSSSSPPGLEWSPTAVLSISSARPGDRIVVSGTIGDHGVAIMSLREGIEFETVLESDTAPLTEFGTDYA